MDFLAIYLENACVCEDQKTDVPVKLTGSRKLDKCEGNDIEQWR